MEDQQRVRLIILAISGCLFGAGYYGYTWYQDQKAATDLENEPVVTMRPARKKPLQTAISTTITGIPPTGSSLRTASSVTNPATAAPPNVVATNPAPVTKPTTIPIRTVTAAPAATQTQVAASTSAVATAAPTVKVIQPKPVTAPPAITAATIRPAAAISAPNSAPPVATVAPAVTAPAPTTAPAVATQAPPVPMVTNDGKHYPATPQTVALATAQVGKGRPDPIEPTLNYKPWPRHARKDATGTSSENEVLAMVPPPPPAEKPSDKKFKPTPIKEKLVPPPPPMQGTPTSGDAMAEGLPIDQLPAPPSRPTIGDKVKVLGVLDDKAIISFPRSMMQKNHWPKTITLGQGEQFESLTIVSINRDGITIEEDGERTLKPIATIK